MLLRRALKVILISTLTLAAAGTLHLYPSSTPGRPQPAAASGPNFILISIDTLRADRLGIYGYARPTSPEIDAWAKQGVLFKRAIAESSWTIPSHVTMLSGLHPYSHGVNTLQQKIGKELVLVSEILRQRGYRTLAVTGGELVSANYGFNQGFDVFREKNVPLDRAITRALEDLQAAGENQPFFLFLHTYQVHCPYEAPRRYSDMFHSDGAREYEINGRCDDMSADSSAISKAQALFLSDRYDGGIRWTDHVLADFFASLQKAGYLRDTYIIFTADHGEAFAEHGVVGHKQTLHREVLFVPLIISGPGLSAHEAAVPAGLMDIVPTILDLAAISPNRHFDGRSLVPWLRDQDNPPPPRRRVSYLEYKGASHSLVEDRWHFMIGPQEQQTELYDLTTDPWERENLAAGRRAESLKLRADLGRELACFSRISKEALIELKPQELEHLRTLGYVK